ncbi:uncharacterized protein [Miscanthus floridulus]|uniref:uncharacterized protein isoform X1 n=1 Tax=Miscanthus floridulus TaxID=154761 RepID=UPI0034592878
MEVQEDKHSNSGANNGLMSQALQIRVLDEQDYYIDYCSADMPAIYTTPHKFSLIMNGAMQKICHCQFQTFAFNNSYSNMEALRTEPVAEGETTVSSVLVVS